MSEALVVQRDTSPGDALIALPVIEALASRYDRLKVSLANDGIAEIADLPANVERVRLDPRDSLSHDNLRVLNLQIIPPDLHPTQVLLKQAGLPYHRDAVPRPKVKALTVYDRFDVVFSPWSRSWNRAFSEQQAQEIVRALSPLRVCVIGNQREPAIDGAVNYRGFTFDFIAGMLRNAKCVLTTDSFPNRLTYAVGQPNHILAFMNATPLSWATHPGATVVNVCPANMNDRITPEAIAALVEAVRGKL